MLFLLALLETSIGLMQLFRIMLPKVIGIALLHMAGTFAPMFLHPNVSFHEIPFSITLVGQYIVKNIVIICGLIMLYPLENLKRT